MKFKVLLLSLTFIFTCMFVGCKEKDATPDNSVVSQNSSGNSSNVETVDNTSEFINDEITAKTDEDTQNTQTENINDHYKFIGTIEAEYDEALNNAVSTVEMRDVHIEFANRWKELADEYYNKLIEDEDLKPYIIQLKTDWEIYYNSQINTWRNIYLTVLEGGSLGGVLFDSKECSLQKDWALQLVNIYTL